MTTAIKTTGKGNVQVATLKGAINAPKHNAETVAAQQIDMWAKKANKVDGLTPFGHKANCQGGLCDLAIIEGHTTTAFDLLYHVASQRKVPVIAGLYEQYGDFETVISHLARRLQAHVSWCANPDNMSYKGFINRLQKTGLATRQNDDSHKAIAGLFAVIAKGLPLYTKVDQVRLAVAKKRQVQQQQ